MAVVAKVQQDAFDGGKLLSHFRDSHGAGDIGAIACFSGTVRDLDGTLEALTLEHYPAMTEKALLDIGHQAANRFKTNSIHITHRYGPMAPGEEIVFVAASAPHRDDAFDACRFIMDYLKNDAPFWKREDLKSGEKNWVEAKDSDITAQAKWDKP